MTVDAATQRDDALKLANQRRRALSDCKRKLKGLGSPRAFQVASDIVEAPNPDQAALRVRSILWACPRFGEKGVAQALAYAGIVHPEQRLRDLSDRQRERLVTLLRAVATWGPVAGMIALRDGER